MATPQGRNFASTALMSASPNAGDTYSHTANPGRVRAMAQSAPYCKKGGISLCRSHYRTPRITALEQTARSIGYAGMLNEPRSAMAKLKTVEELFKGRHFDRDVVILCVRWYLRFKLSLRDLVEMMVERGLSMAHTTSCAGCSATLRSSRNAGADLPEQSAGHGGSTRHMSRSEASGATGIVPSIGPAGRSTSG